MSTVASSVQANSTSLPSRTRSGRVYKLQCNNDPNVFYVGSTTQNLCARLSCHRFAANNGSTRPLHKIMRSLGINNWTISQLQTFDAINDIDLRKAEQQQIDLLRPTLNKKRAYRTNEQRLASVREAQYKARFNYTCNCGLHYAIKTVMTKHLAARPDHKLIRGSC